MILLISLLLTPLIGAILIALLPSSAARRVAMALSVVTFLNSLSLIVPFWQASPSGYVFESNIPWIDVPPIHFHIGVDGLSLWLILLTTLLTPLCLLISPPSLSEGANNRAKTYFALMLLLEFGLVGVFSALDLFLYYAFWEVVLVPMYFLIGIWGSHRRIQATTKFFIYTMAGSVLMLGGIIYLYNRSGSFDYPAILNLMHSGRLALSPAESLWLFLAFFIAFAIKVGLFPLHTWLPDAYTAAPTPAVILLAGVMSKMGAYGLLRFCLPLFPNAARECAVWIVPLALTGILYGALVAMVQTNMKRLVAYSSVSHLGFVVLGIFTFTQNGLDGAVYQMVNHGISTGALFMLVGFLYERRKSLEISAYGGVATAAPNLAKVFMIVTLASIGLPLLNNFVGEYLVLQGAAIANFGWAIFASGGVILAAVYMLWLYQRTFLGKISDEVSRTMHDLRPMQYVAIVPLVALMFWMGIFTQSFMPPIAATNARILAPIDAVKEIQVKSNTLEVARVR